MAAEKEAVSGSPWGNEDPTPGNSAVALAWKPTWRPEFQAVQAFQAWWR